MSKPRQNDGHEAHYADAVNARVRSDRMAAGLPCLVDPIAGDLSDVLVLRAEIKRLKAVVKHLSPFFASAVEESVELVHQLETSGVDPTEPCLADLKAVLKRLADMLDHKQSHS